MKKIGKRGADWIKARAKLIREAVADGRIDIRGNQIWGVCAECNLYRELTPHHITHRSQGGTHESTNIAWLCRKDHMKQHFGKDKKKKTKKAPWQTEHYCRMCHQPTRQLICNYCGQIST